MKENRVEVRGRASGLQYEVVALTVGHRCGYVRVPEGHPLYGLGYTAPAPGVSMDDLAGAPIGKRGIISVLCASASDKDVRLDVLFDVHGSVTFAGARKGDDWWLGFDCAHVGDGKDPSIMDEEWLETWQRFDNSRGTVRTTEYVRSECRSLAKQIVDRYPL